MKVQVRFLPFGESADVYSAVRVNAHPFEGRPVGDRQDHQPSGILEADEAAIKQVIDTGRQEQAVFTVEALFVG